MSGYFCWKMNYCCCNRAWDCLNAPGRGEEYGDGSSGDSGYHLYLNGLYIAWSQICVGSCQVHRCKIFSMTMSDKLAWQNVTRCWNDNEWQVGMTIGEKELAWQHKQTEVGNRSTVLPKTNDLVCFPCVLFHPLIGLLNDTSWVLEMPLLTFNARST